MYTVYKLGLIVGCYYYEMAALLKRPEGISGICQGFAELSFLCKSLCNV